MNTENRFPKIATIAKKIVNIIKNMKWISQKGTVH